MDLKNVQQYGNGKVNIKSSLIEEQNDSYKREAWITLFAIKVRKDG